MVRANEELETEQRRILLDTYALLWAVQKPENLEDADREEIEDSDSEVYVSAAVAWEIAIKHATGNLPLRLYVPARGFIDLAITQEHALAARLLPPIHANPFDRIMIAQAQVDSLTFITRDAHVLTYAITTLRA